MMREPSFEKNMKKLLIITSSGGGGLIQTANAKEQEMLLKNPEMQVVRRDLLKDWLWKPIGEFFINFWNNAQKKGDIPAQLICVYGQFLADIFLHPTIFAYALYTLFKEDVDHIIDTQPLGTSAIIKALRIFNRKRKKNVRLEKVLVDLPTKKATHFFRPIRKLSSKNRKLVQLTSIPPLLEEGETEEQFWRSTCNLSAKEIKIEEVYVRQAFQKFKRKPLPKEPMQMMIRFKNKEELQLMERTFRKGPIQAKMGPDHALFQVDPSDQMITVLLGSQPAKGATLNYIKKFASLVKESPHRKTHLFAFAADHREGEAESLFRQIADTAHQMEYYPQNLTIIPFSFQSEDVIAPLFFRSNITCTRSGGQTAMELMAVSTGEIWLHSEAKEGKNLLSGMPGWEAASAVYLQRMRGAKIVTPETVKYIDIASIHPNLHAGSDL